jgi:hypothetical protein
VPHCHPKHTSVANSLQYPTLGSFGSAQMRIQAKINGKNTSGLLLTPDPLSNADPEAGLPNQRESTQTRCFCSYFLFLFFYKAKQGFICSPKLESDR